MNEGEREGLWGRDAVLLTQALSRPEDVTLIRRSEPRHFGGCCALGLCLNCPDGRICPAREDWICAPCSAPCSTGTGASGTDPSPRLKRLVEPIDPKGTPIARLRGRSPHHPSPCGRSGKWPSSVGSP